MGRKFESQSNNYDKRTINRLRLLVCAMCNKPARQQSVPHYDTQRLTPRLAWTPPPEMLARRPDLSRHMEGGRRMRLARAMYLGSSLYRIHGLQRAGTNAGKRRSSCKP
jgi:hypothetical protein